MKIISEKNGTVSIGKIYVLKSVPKSETKKSLKLNSSILMRFEVGMVLFSM